MICLKVDIWNGLWRCIYSSNRCLFCDRLQGYNHQGDQSHGVDKENQVFKNIIFKHIFFLSFNQHFSNQQHRHQSPNVIRWNTNICSKLWLFESRAAFSRDTEMHENLFVVVVVLHFFPANEEEKMFYGPDLNSISTFPISKTIGLSPSWFWEFTNLDLMR